MSSELVIAIDFDDTFTADVQLWAAFIRDAKQRGHRVVCVTARRESEENTEEINDLFRENRCMVPIVFCNMGSKMWTMEQQIGMKVNIWIDDAPHSVIHGR